ncbi:MAG TPA: phosphonoacetaldehyde hydrolase [Acidimicrobiales bacterium]|nr:phosphonoacetaldehyde hydrolase [Acidimicrobiales bacterium]
MSDEGNRDRHRYRGPLKAAVLDWAGTTVDFGCMAPVATFVQAFSESGVPITVAEARAPMGMGKWEHIQAIVRTPRVASAWQAAHGKPPADEDVDQVYQRFLPLQVQTVEQYSDLIPGALETVAQLRARGLAIAATTGYPREVMEVVLRSAKEHGYEPDVTICAGDTPAGRPGPFMALQALVRLSISPVEAVVKIGDTAVDIGEGLNGGMWAVGVAATGNEVGLSRAEFEALPDEQRRNAVKKATEVLYDAGAHYVVDSIADVMAVVDAIEERLAAGEKP